jgi:hypothetical protein
MTTTYVSQPSHMAFTRPNRSLRVLAIVGAAAAALLAWVISRPFTTMPVRLGSGHHIERIGPVTVVVVATMVGLAGWGLLALLERCTAHARRTWSIAAVVVLVISLGGPFDAGTGGGTKVALVCMHLAVAGILIPVLAWASIRR